MSEQTASQILARLERIESLLAGGPPAGLLDLYELGLALGCKSAVRASVIRYAQRMRRVLRIPEIKTGHRTVRFRPADVERAKARRAGETIGGPSPL